MQATADSPATEESKPLVQHPHEEAQAPRSVKRPRLKPSFTQVVGYEYGDLLVTEGFDRVHVGSAEGWVEAKHDAHHRGDGKCDHG